MKNIEFRIWYKTINRFLTFYPLDCVYFGIDENDSYTLSDILSERGKRFYGDRFVVQQFTGLYDKNNRAIYEGDVIKFSLDTEIFIREVVFQNGYFAWGRIDRKLRGAVLCGINEICEVVSHIFENPDLLEKSNSK